MSTRQIDDYLAALDEPKRTTLAMLREMILDVVPDAEQCLSYGLPAFRVDGQVVAGFGAFENHLSYFPHGRSVLREMRRDVVGYTKSNGALQFRIDAPLPVDLVTKLILARLREHRAARSFAS